MRPLLTFVLGLVSVFCIPLSAMAQDGAASTPGASPEAPPFTVVPEAGADPATTANGYFLLDVAPGEETTGSIGLHNPGTEPVTVALTVVDGQTAQRGGSVYADSGSAPTKAAKWVHPEEPEVTLAPGEQKSVAFSVSPPEETAPGQYLAGLAAFLPAAPEATPTTTEAGPMGASLIVQSRYVIGVQVNVLGDWTPSLSITGASVNEDPSGTKLDIAISNNGDTFLKPEGQVRLVNAEATPILTEPLKLGTFLSDTDITYPLAWPGAPVGGEYGVEVDLNYADDKLATYRGMLTVSDSAPAARPAPGDESQPAAAPAAPAAPSVIQSWMIFTIIGLLALLVILLIVVLLRGRRESSAW